MSYEYNWGSLISQINSEKLPLKDLITKINYWDQFNPAYQFKSDEFIEKNTVDVIYENDIKTVTLKEAAFLKRQTIMSTIGSQIDSSVDAVIELGSGFGRNIFWLYEEFSSKYPNITYIAGEYTDAGQKVCNTIIEKYNLPVISLHFNYYNWNSLYSFITEKKYKNICFYTNYSVEQIPYLNKQLFLDLLKIDNIKFTHIEPIGFQMINGNPQYSGNPNYNQNLVQILTDLENENLIKINRYSPDWFCGDGGFHNVSSLIQWEKI